VITSKPANEGDLATPGMPLLTLEDPKNLRIEADVPEALAIHLEQGQSLPVEIPATDQQLDVTISEISPAADPGSRTFLVKADLPEDYPARPGQYARLTLAQEDAQVILAPEDSLVRWGQMEGVFVVEKGKLHLRLIKTGRHRNEGQVEILSGLEGTETVAVGDLSQLRDRQPVK
jgi:RND family efflux transporter MFP subunit